MSLFPSLSMYSQYQFTTFLSNLNQKKQSEAVLKEYQEQYTKNFSIIKADLRRLIPSQLSLEEILDCVVSLNK